MDIVYTKRNFYPDEIRVLKTLKKQKEKERGGRVKLYYFFIAGLLGVGLTYITAILPDSIWTFIFGTLAVLAFAFIVLGAYEMYKSKKRCRAFLYQLNSIIDKAEVSVCRINAKRIAIAPEYEDESDLYIIELGENEVLHLWDAQYNLKKKFPCLDFDIYGEEFSMLTGRQIYPLSGKVEPLQISSRAKWNFMKEHEIAGHLEIEKVSFDALLEKYTSCA